MYVDGSGCLGFLYGLEMRLQLHLVVAPVVAALAFVFLLLFLLVLPSVLPLLFLRSSSLAVVAANLLGGSGGLSK